MIDLKAYLIEFDTLMSNMIDVLIKENQQTYDEKIYRIILRTSINIKKLIYNTSFDKVYNVYPFKGINEIFNLNINAVDELKRLVNNLKKLDYQSLNINEALKELLKCEKKNLIAICKLYVPRNKQLECINYFENNIYQRNLLKAITNNFYNLGVTINPDYILNNVFENNLKDEYKIPVLDAIIKYHYNGNKLEKRIREIIRK